MSLPLVVTAGAVIGGAGLAAVTSRDNVFIGGLRSFAAAAVVAAVVVQLLPEAIAEIGGAALIAFVVAIALPALAGPLVGRLRSVVATDVVTIGSDVAFYGFVVHQWAEGVALGLVTFPGDGHAHLDLVVGIAAHTVPVTALFVAAAFTTRGRRGALVRTALLVLATVAGFATADIVGDSSLRSLQPWASALAAGFLVHVLLHGATERTRRTAISGPLDLVGTAVGAALPFVLAGHVHAAGAERVRAQLGQAFAGLALETAPMLLLGLVAGAALQFAGERITARDLSSPGAMSRALRGLVVGASRPRRTAGVLSLATEIRRRGAGPAIVLAFLASTRELGPETLLLTGRLLGAPFAAVRLAAALLVAVVVAAALTRVARGRSDDRSHDLLEAEPETTTAARAPIAVLYRHFDTSVLRIAPWTLVGLLAAAYVQVVIPTGSLAGLSAHGLDVLVVGLVAMPLYVSPWASIPLAAVLLLKGLSPGAVLVGLLLGPATNIRALGVLRRSYGTRGVLVVVAIFGAVVFSLGLAVNWAGMPASVPAALVRERDDGLASLAAAAVLGLALVRQLWRGGLRPWLASLDSEHD